MLPPLSRRRARAGATPQRRRSRRVVGNRSGGGQHGQRLQLTLKDALPPNAWESFWEVWMLEGGICWLGHHPTLQRFPFGFMTFQ